MNKSLLNQTIKVCTGKGSRNLRKVWTGEMSTDAAKHMLTVNEAELNNFASSWLEAQNNNAAESAKSNTAMGCSRELKEPRRV